MSLAYIGEFPNDAELTPAWIPEWSRTTLKTGKPQDDAKHWLVPPVHLHQ
jgi:hypothetical protein